MPSEVFTVASPTGLGSDWNGITFTNGKFDIKSIIDKSTSVDQTINTSSYNTTFGKAFAGTGIPETITLTDNTDSNKKYVFKLVANYKDYLDGNNNGNIRYACVETPDGPLDADKQQQFDLTSQGIFPQGDLASWQGSEHKLDFTIASGPHASEGYRENTFYGFTSTVFPSTDYTHVRVPSLSPEEKNKFKEGITLEQVLVAFGITNPIKEMREAFLQMNQDAFDMTGKLVNLNDLDVYIPNNKKEEFRI